MLSPGEYRRCSENSTEKPWKGLACSPARNPSTMKRARRSSRLTWRITSGFRYFSGVLISLIASRPPLAPGPAEDLVEDKGRPQRLAVAQQGRQPAQLGC